MKKILLLLILIFSAAPFYCVPAAAATAEELRAAISHHLDCFSMQQVAMSREEIPITDENLCLATIYAATGMQPLWVTGNGPGADAAVILGFLENAAAEGLRPADYNTHQIKTLWRSNNPDHLARLDTQLTLNLIKYAHDVRHGRISPFLSDPELFAEAGDHHFKPVEIVQQALAAPDLAGYLAHLPPSHAYYRKLREALLFYRNIMQSGGWPTIADGGTMHPRDSDARIRQVRQRLAATGERIRPENNETIFDEQLVLAIKRFQRRYGLKQDGIIGRQTLAALNTTPEELIEKIIVNMARWRWQEEDDFGHRYIMVNIANYDLKAVEKDRVVLEMAVIVGKLQHQTPVFSRPIRYVDFNPFWNIPPNIAQTEELPELRQNRFYLVDNKIRLFSSWEPDAVELDSKAIDWHSVTPREMKRYLLRQDPGPWNALGPVKLVFPNSYNIYIHGTPAQELFAHKQRNFSHGCIRASHPMELAFFALAPENTAWSMEQIQNIVTGGERKVVNISAPLPVYITYQTVWVDNSGIIYFNNDVYGRDRRLAEVLFSSAERAAGLTDNIWDNEK